MSVERLRIHGICDYLTHEDAPCFGRLRFSSASLLAVLSIAPQARAEPRRPNIVFIMADDLGNAGLGYRGGEIRSPNIDKLATEGVRLEDF